ncbi:hypothetical protein LNKW23_39650 [Paralimibaculum aggregatum]|uniref:Uncharacterized protein n=1 Tax=Paralimibaculum aggregatum TaxID=3036245 RepID=A0ABQ6LS41_9RHOB|nr:hypothetical protein [Limibaculum sp. NKW23]GMG84749.1 hypothetical protein LNKW23_39650 [Limibaculum sp. NKW23]
MPIAYWISTELDLVYARHSGRLALQDYLATFRHYRADRNYRPGRAELIDQSTMTAIDTSLDDLRNLLDEVNRQFPGAGAGTPTVLWAPGDLAYAMSCRYRALASTVPGIEVVVEREEHRALAALGLPDRRLVDLLSRAAFMPADPLPPGRTTRPAG